MLAASALDGAIGLEERIVLQDHGLRRALVVQRANLGVRLPVAAVAVDARVETQIVPERDLRVEALLPRRLRVAPEHARRGRAGERADGTRRIRSALLEPGLAPFRRRRSRTARRPSDSSTAERTLYMKKSRDAVADAVLRLTTTADRQEVLTGAEVVDAVAVVGELRADFPRDATALQNAEVRRELVAPRRAGDRC